MLKLGDKTLWGVIIPTIIFGVLFAVPYIDPGPSRLAKNRKVGITVGLVTVLLIVILTYMGTGLWGVAAPPPVELVQEFIPEEGVGEVREIPYDQLFVGDYLASDPTTYPSGELGHVLAKMKEAVDRESARPNGNFFAGDINFRIEDWQTDLKKLTVTVLWEEVPEGGSEREARTFEKVFFIHRESNYDLLESKF
jgi:ubiquinol-cytochrome c reductase cytochrome b subunit